MKLTFKDLLPHIIAVLTIVILSTIYFLPQTQGKVLRQTDVLQSSAMASEISDYKKSGEQILWTNSQFSGMPVYQISAPQKSNVSRYLEKLSRLFFKRPIGYFISGMIVFYISMLLLGVNPWLALLGGIAFAFTTNNLVLYEAGHTSKVRVLMMSALIIAGMFQVFRKKYLVGGVAFAVGMALSLYGNHLQMTYYLGMILGIYGLAAVIDIILKKDYTHLWKSIGVLLIGVLLGLGTAASNIWTTLEYTSSTMRGKPILEKQETAQAKSSSETEGLEWSYSMNWSNGLIDVIAMYIPGVAGGGSSEPIAKTSKTNQYMKRNNLRNLEYGPMYHGDLPFTSGPQYIGAVTFLLFFLSLFFIKGRLRWWAIAALLLTVFISLGKNMEWFNRLLFEYLPLFNKFRSPSSVTSITAILVPFIGILGLNKILKKGWTAKNKENFQKILLIVTGVLSVICLYFAFVGPSVMDFSTPGDARYAQQKGLADAFMSDRASLMRADSLRTLIITLLSAGLLYFYSKEKLSKGLLIGLISVLVIFDLWGVDMRYLGYDSYQTKRTIRNSISERPVDKQILGDSDIHYRVHDITASGGPFNSTDASFHHKTIGGYHAAKLQRYQDIIDNYLAQGNQNVLNMLNAKYVIVGQPGSEEVRRNPGALGNAWFVDNIKIANSNRDELNAVGTIDIANTAVVHEDFQNEVSPVVNTSSGNSNISLESYNPDKLVYKSSSNEEKLAVFSEVWYQPGWHAYIDNEEVELLRANYLLRAVVVPAGEHELVMEFHPKSYYFGEIISLISSIILILGILYAIWLYYKGEKNLKTA